MRWLKNLYWVFIFGPFFAFTAWYGYGWVFLGWEVDGLRVSSANMLAILSGLAGVIWEVGWKEKP